MPAIPRPRRLPVAGGATLALVELAPARPDAPRLLFLGGFHSTMDGEKARALEALAARRGWGSTRFDYRGHGASTGDAAALTLADWLDDSLAVLDAGAGPVILVGSSMGAWLAVLACLERPERVAALALVAAAPDFLQDTLPARLGPRGRSRLAGGGRARLATEHDGEGWPVSEALLKSGRALALQGSARAEAVRCPLRMLHGSVDTVAPWPRAARLFERFGSDDAVFELVAGGDHRLSDARALARLERALDDLAATVRTPR